MWDAGKSSEEELANSEVFLFFPHLLFLLFLPGKGKDIKMILWKLLVLKMEVGTENKDRKKRAGTLRFGQNFCVDRYCLLPNF